MSAERASAIAEMQRNTTEVMEVVEKRLIEKDREIERLEEAVDQECTRADAAERERDDYDRDGFGLRKMLRITSSRAKEAEQRASKEEGRRRKIESKLEFGYAFCHPESDCEGLRRAFEALARAERAEKLVEGAIAEFERRYEAGDCPLTWCRTSSLSKIAFLRDGLRDLQAQHSQDSQSSPGEGSEGAAEGQDSQLYLASAERGALMEQYTRQELEMIATYARWAGAFHLVRKTQALLAGDAQTAADETAGVTDDPDPEGDGEWPEAIYRVQPGRLLNPAALHFGPETGDVVRVVRGWQEAGAEVRRYVLAPETGGEEG